MSAILASEIHRSGIGLGFAELDRGGSLGFFCGELWCDLMDSGAKNDNTVEESMKNLKIDPALKASETKLSGPKEGSQSDAISCISSGDATTSSVRGSEFEQEAFAGDQGMYYYGYCYPGYNSSFGEWDDQSYFMAADNFEMQSPVVQADDGSVLYYLPSYQSGYSPYNPSMPGAVVGVDGQYLGQQSYYPSTMLQQPLASTGFVQSAAYGPEVVSAYPWDSSIYFPNGLHGVYADPTAPSPKSSFTSRTQTLASSKTSTSSKSSATETKEPSLGSDAKPAAAVSKQSLRPINKGAPAVFSKGYIPITSKIPSYTNQGKGGILYPNSSVNLKESGRNWAGLEKARTRPKLHEHGDFDLNEQNRGPRTNSNKNSMDSGVNLVGSPDARKNDKTSNLIASVKKDLYNLPDFPTKYDHALFFVIKSYSEDDIHKSIKYNVWASTPNGNRRLDNAYQLAQEKIADKGSKCPVFLFFSVNASGQFCGVAEMQGRVNFNKNMDFWQQDKWNGFFPVKWHIIKDIPNPQFRHILLENNENKPVTNSRDTQEVKFPQGTEVLNIFKNYSSKTSILDDFDFYENRQKAMQHKRSKPPTPTFDHASAKVEEASQITEPEDPKSGSNLQPVVVETEPAKGDQLTVDVAEHVPVE